MTGDGSPLNLFSMFQIFPGASQWPVFFLPFNRDQGHSIAPTLRKDQNDLCVFWKEMVLVQYFLQTNFD